jgi:small subunit ribosomal protein S6
MKNYELVCILDPQTGDGQYEQVIEKYKASIEENGGEIAQIDDWGLRRLAYTSASLKNRRQGYYVLYQFAGETSLIDHLEQILKLDEGVLRFLLTVVDGEFIRVTQLAPDNFLEEAFARPARGPRDRGGPRRDRDGDDRRPPRDDRRPPRDEEANGETAAEEKPAAAVAEESGDS